MEEAPQDGPQEQPNEAREGNVTPISPEFTPPQPPKYKVEEKEFAAIENMFKLVKVSDEKFARQQVIMEEAIHFSKVVAQNVAPGARVEIASIIQHACLKAIGHIQFQEG